ncbi:MAG: isocitrate/isopropylmalate family dehydrogenase, partial [Kiloniellales bacterium]|nr:isocitrate/isopropylmalate family dehydrogenase [Kiloniellales bacterium]
MPERFKILALGGDGIGPEVVDAAIRLLDVIDGEGGPHFDIEEDLLHGAAWEVHGTFCRDETVEKARVADAVLVGAVGGP